MLRVRCRSRAGSNDQFNGATRHANVGMPGGPRSGDPRTVLVAVGSLRSHAMPVARAQHPRLPHGRQGWVRLLHLQARRGFPTASPAHETHVDAHRGGGTTTHRGRARRRRPRVGSAAVVPEWFHPHVGRPNSPALPRSCRDQACHSHRRARDRALSDRPYAATADQRASDSGNALPAGVGCVDSRPGATS